MLTRADIQQRVIAPAALHYRLAAVAVDVGLMLLAVAPCGLIVVCVGAALSTVFPRTDRDPALSGWLFFSTLGTAWTLYYCRDVVGGGPPAGVCVLRLYVDPVDDDDDEPDERAGRRVRLWLLLNKLHVIVFAITCWLGFFYTFFDASHSYLRVGWWPPAMSFIPAMILLGISTASLLFALGPERRSLFDRLARVRVVRPTFLQRAGERGFAIDLSASEPAKQIEREWVPTTSGEPHDAAS
jgi:hypothetical protein